MTIKSIIRKVEQAVTGNTTSSGVGPISGSVGNIVKGARDKTRKGGGGTRKIVGMGSGGIMQSEGDFAQGAIRLNSVTPVNSKKRGR